MQVVNINYHITTIKYKNFKMINLISILNSIFTILFYAMRWKNKISFTYVLKNF
jgi:hypothetical protein